MTQYVHYLISDIHLERKNEYKKAFLLESINKVIEKNKNDDKEKFIKQALDEYILPRAFPPEINSPSANGLSINKTT